VLLTQPLDMTDEGGAFLRRELLVIHRRVFRAAAAGLAPPRLKTMAAPPAGRKAPDRRRLLTNG
jgi:hypothetical protein